MDTEEVLITRGVETLVIRGRHYKCAKAGQVVQMPRSFHEDADSLWCVRHFESFSPPSLSVLAELEKARRPLNHRFGQNFITWDKRKERQA